jgi:hypothetical protein
LTRAAAHRAAAAKANSDNKQQELDETAQRCGVYVDTHHQCQNQ